MTAANSDSGNKGNPSSWGESIAFGTGNRLKDSYVKVWFSVALLRWLSWFSARDLLLTVPVMG